jgi:hypothetical protein
MVYEAPWICEFATGKPARLSPKRHGLAAASHFFSEI